MIPYRIAALFGALGVALGAFGAHGLRAVLETHQSLQTWQTASWYHLLHAVVLLLISSQTPFRKKAFGLLVAGITAFSGSLYLLALTQIKWLGAITPIGGGCLILGWLILIKRPSQN